MKIIPTTQHKLLQDTIKFILSKRDDDFREREQGFSLLEILIVLIVVGGMMVAIIRGAELLDDTEQQAVFDQVADLREGTSKFYNTYNALPGDMSNAKEVFNVSNVFEGNGNNRIDTPEEERAVWQHLLLAGFINEDIQIDDSPDNNSIGIGSISSFVPGTGLKMITNANTGATEVVLTRANYDSSNALNNSSITPRDLAKFDEKYDDGDPRSGNITAETGADASSPCFVGDQYSNNGEEYSCVMKMIIMPSAEKISRSAESSISSYGGKCDSDFEVGDTITEDCPAGTAKPDGTIDDGITKTCMASGTWETTNSECSVLVCDASSDGYANILNGGSSYTLPDQINWTPITLRSGERDSFNCQDLNGTYQYKDTTITRDCVVDPATNTAKWELANQCSLNGCNEDSVLPASGNMSAIGGTSGILLDMTSNPDTTSDRDIDANWDYSCNSSAGFSSNAAFSSLNFVCNARGEWVEQNGHNASDFSCSLTHCGDQANANLPVLTAKSGVILSSVTDGNKIGSKRNYACDASRGFSKVTTGSPYICQANSSATATEWVGSLPTCEITFAPANISNEVPTYSNPNDGILQTGTPTGNPAIGSQVVFKCDADRGYTGSGVLTYTAAISSDKTTAEWQESGSKPACFLTKCPPATDSQLPGASSKWVVSGGNNVGNIKSYTCAAGYGGTNGKYECRVASSGGVRYTYWHEISAPICIINCPEPDASAYKGLANGFVGTGVSEGDQRSWSCDSGHNGRPSSGTITCKSGSWTGGFPKCKPKGCAWASSTGATFKNNTLANHGDTRSWSCDSGYYGTPSSGTVKCEYGSWQDMPNCTKEPECDSFTNVASGAFSVKPLSYGNNYGTTINWQCTGGIDINTDATSGTSKCGDGGEKNGKSIWSNIPNCKKTCSHLDSGAGNASHLEIPGVSRYLEGDSLLWGCNANHGHNGTKKLSGTSTCTNGSWTNQPNCVPLSCPEIPSDVADDTVMVGSYDPNAVSPESTWYSSDDNSAGAVVDWACQQYYDNTSGPQSGTMECKNGQWEGKPNCIPQQCDFQYYIVGTKQGTHLSPGNIVDYSGTAPHDSNWRKATWMTPRPVTKVNAGDSFLVRCSRLNTILGVSEGDGEFYRTDLPGSMKSFKCDGSNINNSAKENQINLDCKYAGCTPFEDAHWMHASGTRYDPKGPIEGEITKKSCTVKSGWVKFVANGCVHKTTCSNDSSKVGEYKCNGNTTKWEAISPIDSCP